MLQVQSQLDRLAKMVAAFSAPMVETSPGEDAKTKTATAKKTSKPQKASKTPGGSDSSKKKRTAENSAPPIKKKRTSDGI